MGGPGPRLKSHPREPQRQPPFVWPLRARRPPAPPRAPLMTTSSSRCTPSATRTRCAHHPPDTDTRKGAIDQRNPPGQTRGCDQYTRLRALTAASSRLVLSGVAYARPLQVPWWVAARGKYDMIIQGEHAAKQLQARARAQPCSCAPNPLRVPRCARLAL